MALSVGFPGLLKSSSTPFRYAHRSGVLDVNSGPLSTAMALGYPPLALRARQRVDVETANANRSSICQIGIVHVRDGEIQDQWETLINPEDWFDPTNIAIHGIDEDDVIGSPTLPEVCEELRRRLSGSVLVSHTAFDRVAIERALARYELEQLQVAWLDSARIARRAWPDDFGANGWGLKKVAKALGISFKHHDALEDARAVAEVVLRACSAADLDIEGWIKRGGVAFSAQGPNFARA